MKKLFFLLGLFGGIAHAESVVPTGSCTIQFEDDSGIHTEQCYKIISDVSGGYKKIMVVGFHNAVIFQTDDLNITHDKHHYEVNHITNTKTYNSTLRKIVYVQQTNGECVVNQHQAFSCKVGNYMANGLLP